MPNLKRGYPLLPVSVNQDTTLTISPRVLEHSLSAIPNSDDAGGGEILLKLLSRDIALSSWCCIVSDPSFYSLHGKASDVVPGTGRCVVEILVVSEICAPHIGLEVIVLDIPSTNTCVVSPTW